MSELLKKYESIDQSKLNEATIKIINRVKTITADFTADDEKNNKIAEQVLDSVMQKNPDAVKIVKREPKAKPAPKKTHKATHTAKATHKATSAPATKNSDNNIMTVAKQIQNAGESWKDAMERAKVVLKQRKEKVVEKKKTELEKLYALVKTKKELQGFANSDIKRDAVREAKVKGARFVSKEGSTSNAYGTFPNKIGRKYWETRDRHSDRLAPNYPKDMPLLAKGGSVKKVPAYVKRRLEELREEIREERISTGEIAELESLKQYIDPSDVELLQWAGVPEFEEDDDNYADGGSLPFMTDPNFGNFQNTGSFELGGAFMMTDLAGHTGGSDGLGNPMPLSGVTGTNYTGLVGETGAMSSGELFEAGGAMMQNQQVINDASQSYVNYYLGEGASQGIYKDGGSIPNNYEGRTPEDVWTNLTIEQRKHFLFDHQEELPERFTGYYVVNELAKRDFYNSPKEVQFIFGIHVETGQYAYGGKTKSAKPMKELYIEQIASLTGTRTVGVEKFVDDNNLNEAELSNLMTGLGRGMISRGDFVTALTGEKGNSIQKEVIAFAKSDKAYKMADGGFMDNVYAKGGMLNKKVNDELKFYIGNIINDVPMSEWAVKTILKSALTDANFHNASKEVDSIFKRAKYTESVQFSKLQENAMTQRLENKGREIAKMCDYDAFEIIDSIAFYVSMNMGRPLGEKIENLKNIYAKGGSVDDSVIDELWNGYASALLFTETDSDSGEPLDSEYSISDFDKETVASSKKMLAEYYSKNKEAIEESELDLDTIGNDIWYTRSGQGAGFFDHSLDEEVEEKLTKGAKELGEYPSVETYDGKISVRGGKVFAKGGFVGTVEFNAGDTVWQKDEKRYATVMDNYGDPVNGSGGDIRLDTSGNTNIFTYDKKYNRTGYNLVKVGDKGDTGKFTPEVLADMKASANRLIDSNGGRKDPSDVAYYKGIYKRLLDGEFDSMVGGAKGGFVGTVEFNAGDTVWQKDEKRYATVMNNYGDPINGDYGDIRLDTTGNTSIYTFDRNRKTPATVNTATGYNLVKVGEKGDTGKFTSEVLVEMKESANRLIDSNGGRKDPSDVAYYKAIYKRLLDGEFDSMVGGAKATTSTKKGSSDYTYVPNKDVKELSVVLKGELKELMGSDILDGVYVKNSAKPLSALIKTTTSGKVTSPNYPDVNFNHKVVINGKTVNLALSKSYVVGVDGTRQYDFIDVDGNPMTGYGRSVKEALAQVELYGNNPIYYTKNTPPKIDESKAHFKMDVSGGGKFEVFVDSNFVNQSQGNLPNTELKHYGFGDFYLQTPDGNIDFIRTDEEKEGFVGRTHKMKGSDELVLKLVNAMKEKGRFESTQTFADGGFMNNVYANGGGVSGKLDSGVYRVGKPIKVSPVLYEQKIAEIFDNGDISTASDYGRKLSDFKSQKYPIITKEQLEAEYKMADGGFMNNVYAKGGSTNRFVIVEGFDSFKNRPLYQVVDKSEQGEYVGEYHTNRKDAEEELKDLKNSFADGGGVEDVSKSLSVNKFYDQDGNLMGYTIKDKYNVNGKYTLSNTKEKAEEILQYLIDNPSRLAYYRKNEYADGGEMQGNNIDAELEDFDIDNLDPFETMQYNQFVKSSGKVGALQVLINSVEGDYSQLSPELAELAEMQMSQEDWDDATMNERFEKYGYAKGGGVEERLVGTFYYDSRKDKTFRVISSDKDKVSIQYFDKSKNPIGKIEDVQRSEFEYLTNMGAWGKYKQSYFANGGGIEFNVEKGDVFKITEKGKGLPFRVNKSHRVTSVSEYFVNYELIDDYKEKGKVTLSRFKKLIEDGDIFIFPKNDTSFSKKLNFADGGMFEDNDGFMRADNENNYRFPERPIHVDTLDEPIDLTDNVSYKPNEVVIESVDQDVNMNEDGRIRARMTQSNRGSAENFAKINPNAFEFIPMPTSNKHKND